MLFLLDASYRCFHDKLMSWFDKLKFCRQKQNTNLWGFQLNFSYIKHFTKPQFNFITIHTFFAVDYAPFKYVFVCKLIFCSQITLIIHRIFLCWMLNHDVFCIVSTFVKDNMKYFQKFIFVLLLNISFNSSYVSTLNMSSTKRDFFLNKTFSIHFEQINQTNVFSSIIQLNCI